MKKQTLILAVIICIGFMAVCYAAGDRLFTTTVNYENNNYTFTFDDDLHTLDYSLKGYYTYTPKTQIGTCVSKYWAAAGPAGAVVVYKVEPNTFPYVMIHHRTGNVEQKGYLYVDKYDVSDVKVTPTKYGAKVTVYYVTGGDKSFDLQFNNDTIQL